MKESTLGCLEISSANTIDPKLFYLVNCSSLKQGQFQTYILSKFVFFLFFLILIETEVLTDIHTRTVPRGLLDHYLLAHLPAGGAVGPILHLSSYLLAIVLVRVSIPAQTS